MEIAITAGWILVWTAAALAGLLLVGVLWEALCEAFGRQPPPGRLVDVGGGRKLHVLEKGSGPGPTVVLEMGALEFSAYWWGIQDAVAKFARVVSYDRAGFGWSSPVRNRPSMEDRAVELHAMLQAAGIPGPYVLVGHSFGGPLIRLFARNHPESTAGLVFVDTPDEASMFRDSYQAFVRKTMRPMIGMMGFLMRIGALRLVEMIKPEKQLTLEARRARSAMRSINLFRAGDAEFDAILNAPPALRGPHGLGGPLGDRPISVITHGIKFPAPWDVLEIGWDDGQKTLAALSTNSELIVAEKSNHLIQFDEPDLVIDAIRRVWLAARDHKRLAA